MKLHVLSDLHLEFSGFTPPRTDADVIVLAGDIAGGVDGLQWAAKQFERQSVIYVPGNHEYYGVECSEVLRQLRQTAHELGIFLLHNDEVVLDDDRGNLVRFLGCTLWTDFRLFGDARRTFCVNAASVGLNDFRWIKDGGRKLLPEQTARWHADHVRWLQEQLKKSFPGKTVVVTHHLPSARSVAERYKLDVLSACFASELDHLFGPMALWIHGHTHDSVDYELAGTRVICNPRGCAYNVGRPENPAFDPGLVIEV
ncbi:metallophosphoesterase [Orrella daihaiensis]|uniref:Metallophosphoesterase n=1 Tax=Orrella daihaiensis TaxID=2782176 RepID=A0ABY4AJ02_9BURK|nr:metallophosphoesterase [Orrella daihaiensis]UOD50271.1 metallophosphoesterase [Orrella daihaiensis]